MLEVTKDNINKLLGELSKAETRKLKNVITGHGKLKAAAAKVDLHPDTLRRVSVSGKGFLNTITAIREKLLGTGEKKTLEVDAAEMVA